MSPKIVRVTSYFTIVFVKLKTVEEKAISDLKLMIEGSNIEYGNFEKCNIDTKLTSKI